ncbi:ParB/RepB/Spo0J family partition protein [Nocardia sp. NPDC051052]|uniref:ParB/RepB/Spo0J family partition protein n=1 Tax=Nocardia sp. NPDC051052 TaxID=3364322 RepID=UPI0037A4DA06
MPTLKLEGEMGLETDGDSNVDADRWNHLSGPFSIAIEQLQIVGSPRSDGEDPQHIRRIAELEEPLPPIVVHRSTMRVIDGFHRLRAARERGATHIEALYFDGDADDAYILSVRANTSHGLPLSASDRSAAATRIIAMHPDWSDRAIAACAGLSTRTVSTIRYRSTDIAPQLNTRLGRDGRTRPLDGGEGRRRAESYINSNPNASLREIAKAAGISPATARDVRVRLQRGEGAVSTKRPREQSADTVDPVSIRSSSGSRGRAAHLLLRDPSLRSNEMGRALLRMLHAQPIESSEREQLIAGMPPHCLEMVVMAARECADAWHDLAARLSDRHHTRNQ